MKILIINGPNLNLLGRREPEIYGTQSFSTYYELLKKRYGIHQIDCRQTNHEGTIIDWLQEAESQYDGIILNPAAYTHTSIAIADCLKAINIPVVEVHISDIRKREKFRQHSYISPLAAQTIMGKGLKSYDLGIDFLIQQNISKPQNSKD